MITVLEREIDTINETNRENLRKAYEGFQENH